MRIAQNEPYLLVHNLIQSDIFAQCKHGIRLKDTLLLSLFPKQLLARRVSGWKFSRCRQPGGVSRDSDVADRGFDNGSPRVETSARFLP